MTMLKTYKADLHVHTCLSPCTELDMSPRKIARQAALHDIDIIGICDHNSAENVPAVMKAAENLKINVLPGLEVTSQEEVHVLGLFDNVEDAMELQEYVYHHLPGENDPDVFGTQVIVNEKEEVLGFNNRLLIGATTIPLEKIIMTIHSLRGIAIASHIDREAFSIIGQLGFIPENLELDALEISPTGSFEEAVKKCSDRYPITCSSDAHYPSDIGKAFTAFLLQEGTLSEIKKALKNEQGRTLMH